MERRDDIERTRHGQRSVSIPLPSPRGMLIGGALLIVGFLAGRATAGSPAADTVVAVSSPASQTDGTPQSSSSPATGESDHAVVQPDDVLLDLKILSKDNFGSAGSIIKYRVELQVAEPVRSQIAEGDMWEVTFEVLGDEDGPQIDTLRFYGDHTYDVVEGSASTPTTETRLTIRLLELQDLSGWNG